DPVRVALALGFFRRLDRAVTAVRQAGAGGDALTDDDVPLEAAQRGTLASPRSLAAHAGPPPGGGGRRPPTGCARPLTGAQRLGATRCRALALGDSRAVDRLVALEVDHLTRQQGRVGVVDDSDLAEHLANDDLDVLVVDRHTLRAVNTLDAVDEVTLHLAGTHDTHDLLGVQRADQDRLTDGDVLAVLDEKRCTL